MGKSKFKYKVYDGKALKEMLENSRLFVLILLFAAGIIAGALTIKKDIGLIAKTEELIMDFAMKKAGQGVLENFKYSLLSNMLFIITSVFFAFSLIGYPLILIIPFIRGLAMGAVGGYLYSTYKFIGLGYSLLMIYPGAIFSVISLLIICNDCCEYSKNACSKSILGRGHFEKNETKYFLLRQLIFMGLSAIGAVIDGISVALFSGLFNFG